MKEKEVFEAPRMTIVSVDKKDIVITSLTNGGSGYGGIVLPDDLF